MRFWFSLKFVVRSSFYIYNNYIKCLKTFFYDIFEPNTVQYITWDTQIRPHSVAETSLYDTLHISVIITSRNEDNVYQRMTMGTECDVVRPYVFTTVHSDKNR